MVVSISVRMLPAARNRYLNLNSLDNEGELLVYLTGKLSCSCRPKCLIWSVEHRRWLEWRASLVFPRTVPGTYHEWESLTAIRVWLRATGLPSEEFWLRKADAKIVWMSDSIWLRIVFYTSFPLLFPSSLPLFLVIVWPFLWVGCLQTGLCPGWQIWATAVKGRPQFSPVNSLANVWNSTWLFNVMSHVPLINARGKSECTTDLGVNPSPPNHKLYQGDEGNGIREIP